MTIGKISDDQELKGYSLFNIVIGLTKTALKECHRVDITAKKIAEVNEARNLNAVGKAIQPLLHKK